MTKRYSSPRGVTVVLVLVFMGVFALILSAIVGYTLEQSRYGRALYAREQAFTIAESGLEYYKWFLAHYPDDTTNGTGGEGPYTYRVADPEGGELGFALVSTSAAQSCGVTQWVDLSSEGYSNADTSFARTLAARYMRRSVAEYSYILNSNVFAGADRDITGPYHSNGGIRMDGTNNSDVTSSVASWDCTESYGCDPEQHSAAGVVGSGSGSALWRYPVPQVDFAGIASDFSALQSYASADGIFLDTTKAKVNGVQQGGSYSSVGGTIQRGYHLIFNSNGTVSVYRVTSTNGTSAYNSTLGDYTDYSLIKKQTLVGTFTPPSDCAVIFVKAQTWIEGTVSGKVTIVAADTGSFAPDIIISDNLTYATSDGSSGLTATAERNVLIAPDSPDVMSVRGVFVAQTGNFGRNYFYSSSYAYRDTLTIFGSVVSNARVGTQWSCGGEYCNGYEERVNLYDRLLAFSPPPFTPAVTTDYSLVLWREE